ncbi:MAG: helix-turn-helix domain-containing protein [Nitrospirota bacterium]
MSVRIPDKALFRIDEVAALCAVTARTVRNWTHEGKLKPTFLPNGRLRVAREALVALLSDDPEGDGSIKWLGRG